MRRWFAVLLLLCGSVAATAEDLFMVRSHLSFPEAMVVLQESIGEQGYTLSRVQRVDIGLTSFGYETDKYRLVFFGKLDEVRKIADQYPELVPYVPLKIAIFAEDQDTILLSSSFAHLRPFYASSTLQADFNRWESDVTAILERVRLAQ